MCEVTNNNFKEKLPEIRKSLEKAKFISLDLEFSALRPIMNQKPRLFDSNKERYAKLRMNLLDVIPLQVGITAFHFDHFNNDYFGEVFNFYVHPSAFGKLDKSYWLQASTTNFLCLHNFDFNKFAYSGIPFLNSREEAILRLQLKNDASDGENCHLLGDFTDLVKNYISLITKWYNTCKVNDFLEIPEITEKYKQFYEIRYFLHKCIRNRFHNVWTFEKNCCFTVKKVSGDDFNQLLKKCSLDEELVDTLTGFSHVFKLITSLKKPIVGHNLLQDLMIMINTFERELPESYTSFKEVAHQLFPAIFDTKTIYYELSITISKEKLPEDTSLKDLFNYFKDGVGRHLTLNSSSIECNIEQTNHGKFHEAGWDSFCTGYIFLRMAYYNISLNNNYPKSKIFVFAEVMSAISKYKNCVNIIRGATNHIKIDGADPVSKRPPWLVVESKKDEPVDVNDLVSQLSCYGFVDVKKLSPRGNRVLVAVATLRAARDISNSFKTNPRFQIKQYNILRHSPVAQAFILSAVTVSGTILLWLTHTIMRK